jgi:hypothetical protein
VLKDKPMKKKSKNEMADELRPEYDLRKLLRGGVRGKYAERYRAGTNLVLLAPDVANAFPNDDAVNDALRLVIQINQMPIGQRRGAPRRPVSRVKTSKRTAASRIAKA